MDIHVVRPGDTLYGIAQQYGVTVALKDRCTCVASPDGRLWLFDGGNSGLAKGGSGDVLAGVILSLLGQGLAPEQAVPAAVLYHGLAGDLAAEERGEYGMTPMDLVEKLPAALRHF